MKPILSQEMLEVRYADMGTEASIPSIANMFNMQNRTKSHLDEDEGLFISYGSLPNSYPYRQRNNYQRDCEPTEIPVAVLENQYLKATFLPTLGGRLWSLIDKTTGENLLYTNDVIRPSNLSTKNAWFSGGVEWNVAVIGHTPFTTEQLFVGELTTGEGYPVLRMYEFERVRKITYQMDFWLTEESRFLNCRMRISNENDTLVPMYWWSNIAVPEHEGGRLIVPAQSAFTADSNGIRKEKSLVVDGIDVTKYDTIPRGTDYFFDIPQDEIKFISSVNSDGYGLVQASTNKLRGRKLFSWGHTSGAAKWQGYLTEDAGRYIEIQAGVERTQYGCVPMPPNTAWEWIELYGAMKTEKAFGDYQEAIEDVKQILKSDVDFPAMEQMVAQTKETIAKKPAKCWTQGSGYGALENLTRKKTGAKTMAAHLEFGDCGKEQEQWKNLLENGCFDTMDPNEAPQSFMADEFWFNLLKKSIAGVNKNNWYAQYQLGLFYYNQKSVEEAEECFQQSVALQENCWAYHAMAVLSRGQGKQDNAAAYAYKATTMRLTDLSMAKDCADIMLSCGKHDQLLQLMEQYPTAISQEPRMQMYQSFCWLALGEVAKADELLTANGGLEVADIREGEMSITDLWYKIEQAKNPEGAIPLDAIPSKFNFRTN